mgnify:CR=1 FL=1
MKQEEAETMKKFKRIFVIVMDSFGAGHAKDGAAYGDDGADTMGILPKGMITGKFLILPVWDWQTCIL